LFKLEFISFIDSPDNESEKLDSSRHVDLWGKSIC